MYIYSNDQLVKKEEAKISPFDHGFLYGVGLFETFRIYDGHPFLLEDHLQRLNEGLDILNIARRFSLREVEDKLSTLIEANGYENAYIRMNVSAGIGDIGLRTHPYEEPVVIIFSKELPPGDLKPAQKEAVLLKIARNTPEGSERLKSHHYLNNILAKREIGDDPAKEGIFLTRDGYLAEGIVSNLFWCKDGTLFTPALTTGILNGITRQFLMKLGDQLGLQLSEGLFKPEDILAADEIFLTNSIQEVVGVTSFLNREFPGGDGPLLKKLHNLYRQASVSLYSRNEMGR